MNFYTFSLSAIKSLEKFNEHQANSADSRDRLLLEIIDLCDYQVLLIADDEPILSTMQQAVVDEETLVALYNAWRNICRISGGKKAFLKKSWQMIDRIGKGVPFYLPYRSLTLRRFCQPKDEDFFFILLTSDEPDGLPAFELLMLCNLWQLKHDFFQVHASGIKHKGHLYLFTGPSGAGKSTVASISNAVGDQVIDEDQVLVHLLPGGGYSADGWGYGLVSCATPLQAIFRLVQDSEERLIPINQLQTVNLVLERHIDILGGMLSEDLLRQSFRIASEIARHVPGYELHFRKSSDFWKLIDEQFPD